MPVAYIIDTIAESKSKTKLFPARSTESAYVNGLIQERVSRSKENTLSDTLFSEYSYLRSSPDHWVRLVQQELIFECYKLLGTRNWRCPERTGDEDDDDEPHCSNVEKYENAKKRFYNDFLSKEQDSFLQPFLSASRSRMGSMTITAEDLLDIINPAKINYYRDLLIHDITFDDMWLLMQMLKDSESESGSDAASVTAATSVHRWEALVVLLTDNADVAGWRDNLGSVPEACRVKLENMQAWNKLRNAASEFEEAYILEREREYYAMLEKKGLVVSLKTLNERLCGRFR